MFMRSGLKRVCDWALLAHAGEDFGARITLGAIGLELGWCLLTFEKRIAGRGLVRGDHARAETCALGFKVAVWRKVCLGIVGPGKRAHGLGGHSGDPLFAINSGLARSDDCFVHRCELIAGGAIGARSHEGVAGFFEFPRGDGNLSGNIRPESRNDSELLIREQRLARDVPRIVLADAFRSCGQEDFRTSALVVNRFDSIHRIGLLCGGGDGRLLVGLGWPGGIGIVRRCAIRLTLGRVALGCGFGVW